MSYQSLRRSAWSVALATLVVLATTAGCEKEPPPEPLPGPTTRKAKATTAPIHAITGRVSGQDGKPITLPGSRIVIEIVGVSDKTGERLEYYPNPDADGFFKADVLAGTYGKVAGRVEFQFNNKNYRFDLDPIGDNLAQRDSASGIKQDFVWKLSGLRPGMQPNSHQAGAFYGASIRLDYRSVEEGVQERVRPAPTGTRLLFTLAPQGKLADGTEGQVLTRPAAYNTLGIGVEDDVLVDVPLAMYRLSGEEIYPNGSRRPLQILDVGGIWNGFTIGTFEPDLEHNRTLPVSVRFKRTE